MAYRTFRFALAGGVVAAVVATSAAAQNQQVYRYVDKEGRFVYSDRGPPSDAKDVQAKRMRGNLIEDSGTPIASQQAQERFPVTLYSFSCGEVCTQAESLLNRRAARRLPARRRRIRPPRPPQRRHPAPSHGRSTLRRLIQSSSGASREAAAPRG